MLLITIPALAWAEVPKEVIAAMATTQGYKHEWVALFQPPQYFHERKRGNCVDFAMHWEDVLLASGVKEERIERRVEDNSDGTSHMTLVVDGQWQMSAEPAGQFVHDLNMTLDERYDARLKLITNFNARKASSPTLDSKLEKHYLVTAKGARIVKASKEICERDAQAASKRHNVHCEKAGR